MRWAWRWAVPAVLASAAAAAWLARATPADTPHRAAKPAPGFSLLAAGSGAPALPAFGGAAPAGPHRPADEVMHALFTGGSLRGTRLDGDWGVDAQGELRPSRSLRRRFDHLLTALGEATPAELRAIVAQQARRDTGEGTAAAILDLWDRYLGLQTRRWTTAALPQDPGSLQQALAERQLTRREVLGPAWADAFYREEEGALLARLDALRGAGTPVAPPEDLAPEPALHAPAADATPAQREALHRLRIERFGAEAAWRLQAEDEEAQRWEARLAEARRHLAALERAPELSPPQRLAAMRRHVAEQFTGTQALRARALLGL